MRVCKQAFVPLLTLFDRSRNEWPIDTEGEKVFGKSTVSVNVCSRGSVFDLILCNRVCLGL